MRATIKYSALLLSDIPSPRTQNGQQPIRQIIQRRAYEAGIEAGKRATHLRVFSDAHMAGPGKLTASCTLASVKTTLLSVTVKTHEKVGLRGASKRGVWDQRS